MRGGITKSCVEESWASNLDLALLHRLVPNLTPIRHINGSCQTVSTATSANTSSNDVGMCSLPLCSLLVSSSSSSSSPSTSSSSSSSSGLAAAPSSASPLPHHQLRILNRAKAASSLRSISIGETKKRERGTLVASSLVSQARVQGRPGVVEKTRRRHEEERRRRCKRKEVVCWKIANAKDALEKTYANLLCMVRRWGAHFALSRSCISSQHSHRSWNAVVRFHIYVSIHVYMCTCVCLYVSVYVVRLHGIRLLVQINMQMCVCIYTGGPIHTYIYI